MKAIVYRGLGEVALETVSDPTIQEPPTRAIPHTERTIAICRECVSLVCRTRTRMDQSKA
jgi:hypothetical protein